LVLPMKLRTFRIERAAAKLLLAEKEAKEAETVEVVGSSNDKPSVTE